MKAMGSIENQYLRPEDLPITDAKKSPLALLAMTCSNIGADIIGSHVKPLSAYDKPSNHHSSSNKKSRSSAELIDSEEVNATDNSSSPRDTSSAGNNYNTSHLMTSHHVNSRSPSASSSGGGSASGKGSTPAQVSHSNNTSSGGQITFKPYEMNNNHSNNSSKISSHHAPKSPTSNPHTISNHKSDHNNRSHNRNSSGDVSKHDSRSSNIKKPEGESPSPSFRYSDQKAASDHPSSYTSSSSLSSSSSSLTSTTPSSSSSTRPTALETADAIMRSNPAAYAAAVMSQTAHHHLMSASKSAGVCRDPFCTGCHLSPAAFPGLSGVNPSHLMPHHFAGYPGYSPLTSSSSSHLNHQQQPKSFVCSWAANGAFCGKNFNTGDELLQHLKNHTSASSAAVAAASNPFGSGGLSASAFGQYPPHLDPLLSSPVAGLRRTAFDLSYRYHPYKAYGLNPGSPLVSSGLFNHHTGLPSSSHPHHHPVPGFAANGWRPDSVHSLRTDD